MTDKQQSDALRLVALLDAEEWPGSMTVVSYARECVAELLRQHGELETLRTGYAAARLEIESLKAQLHAAKQINAAQFGLLTSSIPGSALRASHWQAPSGATEEVENLRKALVYVAFALHDTPQYMLAQGITLIDGDTVRVSRDGWTVEASVNPHRQPAPAPMSPANRLVAYSAATRLRELGFEWDATAEAWLQPAPSAQAADSVLEDAARYRWLREGNDAKHGAAWYVAVNLYGCEWDAAIDAAMNKGGAT